MGNAIITESTLSFLGLGFPPDIPTWGQMLYTAKDYLLTAPHLVLAPGLAIFLTVLSINYSGEGLKRAFGDRQLRNLGERGWELYEGMNIKTAWQAAKNVQRCL